MNRKFIFSALCGNRIKIFLLLSLLVLNSGHLFAQQTLYAISGYNSTDATLYKLNASTGATIATIGNTGLSNVTNMAVDPLSGQIYVQASHAVDSQLVSGQMQYLWQGFLYIVDSLTGIPTQVDTTTDTTTLDLLEPPYIIFSPAGNMYEIDLSCHCLRDQIGVSFDNICHLFYKDEFNLIDIDTTTGEFLSFASINGVADNMFSVDINDNFYSGQRLPGAFVLKTIDKFSGFVSFIGSNTVENMAAIAFGPYRPVLANANSIAFCSGSTSILMSPPSDAYQWKLNGNNIPGATSQTYMASQSGSYNVEMSIGCGTYQSSSTIINTYPLPVLSTVVNNVNCFGNNNGSIDLTVMGSAVATYNWSNGATNQDITNLSPGTYSVTVTDVNNCQLSTTAAITQPLSALTASSGSQNNPTSGNNGNATVIASGGTTPYTYSWSPSGGSNATASGLGAGTYTVTIIDARGCTAQQVFNLVQSCNISFTANVTNVSCNGSNSGAIDVTITSGSGQYTYSWSNGATTQDLTNRPAGVYTLTVSTTNGCSQTQSFTITQPAPINIFGATTNVSCYNAQNGSIDISVSGGTTPYTYVWADVNSNNLITWLIFYYSQWCNSGNYNGWPGSNIHTQDRTGLDNGCYYVKVIDANGCTSIANYTIYQPSPLCISSTKSNASCANNNGTINQAVSGGTAPYSYQWSNGATTKDVSGLSAGNYSVVITDAHGCTENRSYSISQAIANITVSANKTNALCTSNTGSINISVSGGGSPYTYLWSNGATTQDIYNVPAGNYSVNITDANGCVKNQVYTLSATSANICVTSSKTNASCANTGGAINISVSGGTAPYLYQWSNGATTQDISNISSGTYIVNVTDANGCALTQSYSITQSSGSLSAGISVSPQNTVSGQQSYTIFLGYGSQSVTLTASMSGGTAPYTRQWSSTTSTNSSITVSPTTTTIYTLTVTDKNGCTASATRTIIVKDIQAPNGKIYVCHNGTTTAVSTSQLNTHLCHGDDLGQCLPSNNCRTSGGGESDPEPKELVLEAVANQLEFNVYPNPSTGTFIIDIPNAGDVDATITDETGKVVDKRSIRNNTEQHMHFDMQNVARGIYMVRIVVGGEVYQSKIVLQ